MHKVLGIIWVLCDAGAEAPGNLCPPDVTHGVKRLEESLHSTGLDASSEKTKERRTVHASSARLDEPGPWRQKVASHVAADTVKRGHQRRAALQSLPVNIQDVV
jgi:hypothetical protein